MSNNRPKEKELVQLLDKVPAMLYRFMLRPDGSTCFPYINDWGLRLFNLDPDIVAEDAEPMLNMVHPDDGANFQASIQESADTLQAWQWEGRANLPDGNMIYIQANATPEARDDGTIVWSGLLTDITDRKLMEEKLANNETVDALDRERKLLRTLIDNLPGTHFFVKDTESRFVITNAAHLQMLGLEDYDEVIGKTDFDFYPAEVAQDFFDKEQEFLASGVGLQNQVVPSYGLQGEPKWYLVSRLPQIEDDGTVTGLVGMTVDITEQKQMEEALLESEERLRSFLNALPDVAFILNAQGQYLDLLVSETNQRYNADTAELIKGHYTHEFVTPEVNDLFLNTIEQTLKTDQPQVVEYTWQDDRGVIWYEGRTFPMGRSEDADRTVLWIARDITDRVRSQADVKAQQAFLRQIIDTIPHFIFTKDWDGRITLANKAIADFYGTTPEGLIETTAAQVATNPKDLEQYLLDDREVISSAQPKHIPAEINHDSAGDEYWFETIKVPLLETDGTCNQILGVATDITERRRAEEALLENERRLQIFNDALVKLTRSELLESGNLSGALAEMTQTLTQALEIDRASIWLYSDQQQKIECIELYEQGDDRHSSGMVLSATDFPSYFNGLAEDRMIVAQNAHTSPHTRELSEIYLMPLGIDAMLNAPIRVGGKMVGVVCNEHMGSVREWSLIEQNFANSIADLVSLALEVHDRVELEEQMQASLQRRSHQVQIATQISQEIAVTNSEQALYSRVVTTIKEQFGFYHVQLFRYNPDEARLDLVAGYGQIGDALVDQHYGIPMSRGWLGQAAAFGQPVLLPDLSDMAGWEPHPLLPDTKGRLLVPIKLGEYDSENLKLALQNFIDHNFIGYIVHNNNPEAISPLCQQAVDNGLIVIGQGTHNVAGQTASVRASDEFDVGYMLGCEAGAWAKAHIPDDEILQVVTFDYLTDELVSDRQRGMISGLEKILGRDVAVIANEIAESGLVSQPIAERWLKQYPDLKMVLAVNDSVGLGAYRALKAIRNNSADDFFIGGVDGLEAAIDAIAEGGAFQATVDQQVIEQAHALFYALIAAATGLPFQTETIVQVKLINRQNWADIRAHRAAAKAIPLETNVDLTGKKIGLSLFNLDNPFFATISEIIRYEAATYGLEVFVHEPKPLLGVIEVQSDAAGQLEVEDQLTLEGIAGQIALAIEKTRLLEQASIFRQFTEAAGQGMGFSTLNGDIVYFNPTMGMLLGESNLEDALGKSIYHYYSPESATQLKNEVLLAIKENGHWSGELSIIRMDGSVTPTIQNFSLIYDNRGLPLYLANVVTDITERKQAEADLEARLYELNALQGLMSREAWVKFQASRDQTVQGYIFDQQSTQPVSTADIQKGNSVRGHLPTRPTQENGYALSRSMAVYGEIIGQLGVYDDPKQPLAAEDQEFLDSITAEVSGALERARLLEQIQRRAVELEAVAQVSTAVSTILDTTALLQTVVNLTQKNFNLYEVAIFTYDAEQETLTLASASGEVGQDTVNEDIIFEVALQQSLLAAAAKTRQMVLSNDVLSDERFMPHPKLPNTRSELVLPMLLGERLIGVMDLQSEQAYHFTDEEIQTYTTLVTQVAVALENTQLFEAQRKTALETENLYAASRQINEATTLQEIVDAVAQLERIAIINRVLLFLFEWDEAGEVMAMELAANWYSGQGHPPSPVGRRYTQGETSTVHLMTSEQPLFFEDMATDARMDAPLVAVAEQQKIKAMAVIPLRVGGKQLGTIIVQAEERYKFTEQDIQAYLSLAPQIAVAVNNLILLSDLQDALAEVETTQRRYTLQTWDAYRSRTPVIYHEHVREDTQLAKKKLPATVAQAVNNNQSTMSLSSEDQKEPGSLVTPLRVRGEVVGVLGLEEIDPNHKWTPEEVALIEAVAVQMAQAAENLRLLDETQQRAAREQRVNEIGDKIQGAQSLEEALQIAVREVGLSLQAPETFVKVEIK